MTGLTPLAVRSQMNMAPQLGIAKHDATATDPAAAAAVQKKVRQAYSVIRKYTGTLGGDGSGGPIYGEITERSFQNLVNAMKEECNFGANSLFIDIGSGLGKPNVHAAIDPGVKVSFGVEVELLRWQLSLHNLKHLVGTALPANEANVLFAHADITKAITMDPFTHVYMFDVGFPPEVMTSIAEAFNRSKSAVCLLCFHNEKTVLSYGFDVVLLRKISTSMAGSSEGHMAYLYRPTHLNMKMAAEKAVKQDKSVAASTPAPKQETTKSSTSSAFLSLMSATTTSSSASRASGPGVVDLKARSDPLFHEGVDMIERTHNQPDMKAMSVYNAWVRQQLEENLNSSSSRSRSTRGARAYAKRQDQLEKEKRMEQKQMADFFKTSKKNFHAVETVVKGPRSVSGKSKRKLTGLELHFAKTGEGEGNKRNKN